MGEGRECLETCGLGFWAAASRVRCKFMPALGFGVGPKVQEVWPFEPLGRRVNGPPEKLGNGAVAYPGSQMPRLEQILSRKRLKPGDPFPVDSAKWRAR